MVNYQNELEIQSYLKISYNYLIISSSATIIFKILPLKISNSCLHFFILFFDNLTSHQQGYLFWFSYVNETAYAYIYTQGGESLGIDLWQQL